MGSKVADNTTIRLEFEADINRIHDVISLDSICILENGIISNILEVIRDSMTYT